MKHVFQIDEEGHAVLFLIIIIALLFLATRSFQVNLTATRPLLKCHREIHHLRAYTTHGVELLRKGANFKYSFQPSYYTYRYKYSTVVSLYESEGNMARYWRN